MGRRFGEKRDRHGPLSTPVAAQLNYEAPESYAFNVLTQTYAIDPDAQLPHTDAR